MESFKNWRRKLAVTGGLGLAMLVGAAAGLAWTQELPAQRGRGPGGPGGSPIFAALDANQDGVVAGDELANAAAALARLDRDGNGALEAAELRPAFGRGREGRGPGRGGPGETPAASPDDLAAALMAFDANGDGRLTRTEVPGRMQGLLDRADTDKSGSLTEAELKASAAAQGGPRGERGTAGEREEREGRRPEGGPRRGDPLAAALDTNRDGTIGGEELAAAAASLKALDADGDGQVTRVEVRSAFGGGRRDPRH